MQFQRLCRQPAFTHGPYVEVLWLFCKPWFALTDLWFDHTVAALAFLSE